MNATPYRAPRTALATLTSAVVDPDPAAARGDIRALTSSIDSGLDRTPCAAPANGAGRRRPNLDCE